VTPDQASAAHLDRNPGPITSPGATRPEGGAEGPALYMEELDRTLWALRRAMALVDYRATVARLMLGADDRRFVSPASEELAMEVSRFRGISDEVVAATGRAAQAWGMRPAERSLTTLADRAPSRWKEPLDEHIDALSGDIERLHAQLADQNALLTIGQRQIQRTVDLLLGGEETAEYRPTEEFSPGRARFVDHLA